MIKLADRMTESLENIYSVRNEGTKTFFLIHAKEYGWSWVDSSYYEPKNENI